MTVPALPPLRRAHVLVTGAFGFVGGHLTRRLVEEGAIVTALDCDTHTSRPCLVNLVPQLRERVIVANGDVTDSAFIDRLLAQVRFDLVFHFASSAAVIQRAHAAPLASVESNAMGVVHLLDALRRGGHRDVTIVHASSDKVYGDAGGEPYSEEHSPLDGEGIYEVGKIAADLFARRLARSCGARVVVSRMCNLFGPCDVDALDYRIVPRTMAALFARPRRRPQVYGHARQHRRDYLYVEDAVRALLLLAARTASDEAMSGHAYNLAGIANLSTEEICLAAIEAAAVVSERRGASALGRAIRKDGFEVTAAPVDAGREIAVQRCNGERMRMATGFQPAVPMADGLQRTAEFYRGFLGDGNSVA